MIVTPPKYDIREHSGYRLATTMIIPGAVLRDPPSGGTVGLGLRHESRGHNPVSPQIGFVPDARDLCSRCAA